MKITLDNKQLIVSDFGGNLYWLNIKNDTMVRKLYGYHKAQISSITLSWDGGYLMSADHNGVIKQTCVSTGKCIKDYGKVYKKPISKTLFGLWGYKSRWD
jgi:WD40 repeat protein